MSHGCPGWPSGRLLRLRPSGHFLYLLSQPPLSQMPSSGTPALAGTARTRSARRALLPRRLYLAPPVEPALSAQPAAALRSALPRQRSDHARSCGQPQAPRSQNRLPQHFAHLGTEPATASSSPLRCSRRRFRPKLLALGSSQVSLLPPCQGPQPRLSRQVSRSPSARTPAASTRLLFHPLADVATT